MYDNLYCKIFINAELSYEDLFALVMKNVAGEKEAVNYINTRWFDICVQKNKEYNLTSSQDFVHWRYYLDIEPNNVETEEYISRVCELVSILRGYCEGIVVVCDFEEEVNGRIKDINTTDLVL